MKKIILSTFVILSFFVYAIYQRRSSGDIGTTLIQNTSQPVSNSITTPKKVTPNPSSTPNNTSNSTPNNTPNNSSSGAFKNGSYTGDSANAYYGDVQVKAIIISGKLSDVQFLSYPSDRQTSAEINNYATKTLKSEAIRVQSANVDAVSGATLTTEAFKQSLQSALDQAH